MLIRRRRLRLEIEYETLRLVGAETTAPITDAAEPVAPSPPPVEMMREIDGTQLAAAVQHALAKRTEQL
jgi:hypothetical protein